MNYVSCAVLLNLPYLGMETEDTDTLSAHKQRLNLPYLGMETYYDKSLALTITFAQSSLFRNGNC